MADFRIVVVVDPSGAQRGARQVEGSLNRVGKSASRLKGLLAGAFAIGALTSGISAAIRTTSNFQDSLAEVSTLIDGTAAEMDILTQAALDQAKAFGSQPIEQTRALYQIISAGATSASQATETLTAANKLAVGGVTDIATAADGLTSILNAYGSEVGTATDVSDAFFVAMRAGKTTVEELSSSLGKVAPLAASAGVSFDETAAAVAALTKGGISTTEAVTGLRAVMAAVVKPTSEAAKQAELLGIDFSAAALESQGLAGFLENLTEKTGGSTDVLAQLFGGVEALVPILALTGKSAEDFADTLEDMGEKAGSTQTALDKIAKSPGFQIGRLASAVSAEIISAFSGITSSVGQFAKLLADNFDTVINVVQTLAIALGTTLALKAIPSVVTAVRVLTVAIATNPIGLLLTAITLGISALIAFREQLSAAGGSFGELSDTVSAVISLFDGFGAAIVDSIALIFPSVGQLNDEFSSTADVVNQVILDIVDRIDLMRATFLAMKDAVLAAWASFPGAFKGIVIDAVNGAIELVESGINRIIEIINKLPKVDISTVDFGGIEGGGGVDAVTGAATSALEQTFRAERGAINDLVIARKELIETTREAEISDEFFARQLASSNAVVMEATDAVEGLEDPLNNAAAGMDAVGSAAAMAKPAVEDLADTVVEKSNFMMDALDSVFSSASDALSDFITTGKVDFKSLIDDMLKNITKLALNNVFGGGGGGGGGLGGLFSGLFGGGGGGGGGGGLFSGLGSLFGFAHGGGLTVGGTPGRDNNLLSINNRPVARVSRGERIDVTPQGGNLGRPVNVNMTVVTPDAESFQRSGGQIQARIQAGLSRASRRNN